MKRPILLILLVVFVYAVSGCGKGGTATSISSTASTAPLVVENKATPISPTASTEPLAVEDKASLVAALQASGATVEAGDLVTQVFFSPEGSIIKVNGADVQVFEYESAEAMENEASEVAPDGGSIGTSMVTWVDTPHFYKTGRIIVLYVGSDEAVTGLLESALGPQFAGR